jgi:L-histidine Nalpha-methyltransferase
VPLSGNGLREEVLEGLRSTPRTLPPKLFYDARGAELFEAITRLPEYYLTRTEVGIFRTHLPEMARKIGPEVVVVEFGSGSGEKTDLLLRALADPRAYVSIDVAREQLDRVAARIDRDFPSLGVYPLPADYTRPFTLPPEAIRAGRPLIFFPGSTIGNFHPAEGSDFLKNARTSLGQDASLLIGIDLRKPRAIVEPAYNDAAGVTAEFNRNALRNLNRLLDADFEPEAFKHEAVWNDEASRIEMWLVASRPMTVRLPEGSDARGAEVFEFREGDRIVTEYSYKFTLEGFDSLTSEAGWERVESWSDPEGWFAVQFLTTA